MTDNAIIITSPEPLAGAITTYLSGLSELTEKAYRARLGRFMAWRADQEPAPFVAHLKAYVTAMQEAGLKARSVQAHISTIKGLIKTAAALDPELASGLPSLDLVKPPSVRGEIQGDRLSGKQRQALIDLPGTDTLKGIRDTAILLLLAVCGLRRSEVCNLTWGHLSELDGHQVIKNLKSKHGRVRTIKLPVMLRRYIEAWGELAGIPITPEAPVFVRVGKAGKATPGKPLAPEAIAYLVKVYCARIGMGNICPHDLRRTAAREARRNGASIEQVQILLGHASPQTTSEYIGETLDLDDNAVDYGIKGLKLPSPLRQAELPGV